MGKSGSRKINSLLSEVMSCSSLECHLWMLTSFATFSHFHLFMNLNCAENIIKFSIKFESSRNQHVDLHLELLISSIIRFVIQCRYFLTQYFHNKWNVSEFFLFCYFFCSFRELFPVYFWSTESIMPFFERIKLLSLCNSYQLNISCLFCVCHF